jgi:hypothetical protein
VVRTEAAVGSTLLPLVNRVVALLKRWLLGTHQGAVQPSHLDAYLDEFTFRFNRRTSRSRGKLFYRLAQQVVAVDPVPAKKILGRRSKASGTTCRGNESHVHKPIVLLRATTGSAAISPFCFR